MPMNKVKYFSKHMLDRLKEEENKITTKAADLMMSRFGLFAAVVVIVLSVGYLTYHLIKYWELIP